MPRHKDRRPKDRQVPAPEQATQRATARATERDHDPKAQIRLASFVILGAFGLWMLASALGGALGVPVRFAFLIDIACMAALIFALVNLFRAWRASQPNRHTTGRNNGA